MAAGQGNKPAAAGGGGAAQSGQGQAGAGGAADPSADADQQFLEMTTKLLKVLQSMKEMTPRGQDISKYMDAMTQTTKDCVKQVFGGADQSQTPGTDTADTATNPGGGPSAPAAGGQPGANAGAPPAQ
jgi:hypothetical protein